METQISLKEEEKTSNEIDNNTIISVEKEIEVLMGFKFLNVKIYLMTGDIESIFKKKR
jgi:hypothetical protein